MFPVLFPSSSEPNWNGHRLPETGLPPSSSGAHTNSTKALTSTPRTIHSGHNHRIPVETTRLSRTPSSTGSKALVPSALPLLSPSLGA
ncbi:unnamed protein product [Protopolystoma xenopodis]|uniref:Uncharacterized protein n=1 Tax=Protopolystoma xenopodis TaxID=117903 RepID=A0A448XPY4_9PLAT|nr:unnamed protein product [Protopolystoma xenopodis]